MDLEIIISELNQGKDKYHRIALLLLQNRPGGVGCTIYYNGEDPPFFSRGLPPLGSLYPPPEERCLSMPEIGEKERNYLFKSYTDLE